MRYRIYFTTGEQASIDEADFNWIQTGLTKLGNPMWWQRPNGTYLLINTDHITHIIPENEVGAGAVVKPKSPAEVQRERDNEFAKIATNPDNILSRARGNE